MSGLQPPRTNHGAKAGPLSRLKPPQCRQGTPDQCRSGCLPQWRQGTQTNVGAEACTSDGREPKPMSERKLAPVAAGNTNLPLPLPLLSPLPYSPGPLHGRIETGPTNPPRSSERGIPVPRPDDPRSSYTCTLTHNAKGSGPPSPSLPLPPSSGGREPKPMSEQRLAPVAAGNPNQCRSGILPSGGRRPQTNVGAEACPSGGRGPRTNVVERYTSIFMNISNWSKDKEMVGSKVHLGLVRPDGQLPSQSYLCMEVVPWLLNVPPPEVVHQDTPERSGQAQLPRTSVRPTTGFVVYQLCRLVPEFNVLLTLPEGLLSFRVSRRLGYAQNACIKNTLPVNLLVEANPYLGKGLPADGLLVTDLDTARSQPVVLPTWVTTYSISRE